jgi:hypothetical protein
MVNEEGEKLPAHAGSSRVWRREMGAARSKRQCLIAGALGHIRGEIMLLPNDADSSLHDALIPTRRRKAMQRRAPHTKPVIARLALAALATITMLGLGPASLPTVHAALQEGSLEGVCTGRSDVLIGQDNDNDQNPVIQPPNTAANQSLNNTDVLVGEGGCDILIGLLGSDVMDGGEGADILIGGTEQGGGGFPNSDIMFGGPDDDISLWAGGDGSDAFIGGSGRDAQVFGTIDRDANNVPILSPVEGRHNVTGLPTAEVTNQGGFCTLERVPDDAELGFAFLVRFFVRSTGALAVTIRLSDDVEQVFCTSEAGGAITFANLRAANPTFVEVSLDQVRQLNRTVAQIIR